MMDVTGTRNAMEVPKSPFSMLSTKITNCVQIERSKPICWRRRVTASSVARSPSMALTGSPGSRRASTNTTTPMARNVGTIWKSRAAMTPARFTALRSAGAALRRSRSVTLRHHFST